MKQYFNSDSLIIQIIDMMNVDQKFFFFCKNNKYE